MNRTTLDLWVGFFVAMGLAALVFLALKVGNLASVNAADSYTIKAHFDNIGGLKVRAPVKSSGVVVGRVSAIDFDASAYDARVTLQVDSHYQFPRDTFAKILTSGLPGEQYVGLAAGGDPQILKPGDEIKKTQSAVVMEDLIGQFLFNKAQEAPAPGK
jgi:phospholipid/cholesterol/gamma-HCH transport system substrate-binding protein